MKNLSTRMTFIALLPAMGLISGCKKSTDSENKSFVGLEADIDQEMAKGQAPSYVALQTWFKGAIPVDKGKAQVGGIKYQVHSEFNEETWQSMPPGYRTSLIAYFEQQAARVSEFQNAEQNPEKLKELLRLESAEMYDILRALVDVSYKPITKDLLAHLISQPGMRNYVDRFSLELLEKLYQKSLRNLISNLALERDNFANLMIQSFINKDGANEKFTADLKDNCASLQNLLSALGEVSKVPCKSSSAGFQLSGSQDLQTALSRLTGGGRKFIGLYGGTFAPGGPAMASGSNAPSLSIFQGKDTSLGDPKNNSGSNPPQMDPTPTPGSQPTPTPSSTPSPSPTPTGGGPLSGLATLLSVNWSEVIRALSGGMGLAQSSEVMLENTAQTLPRAPDFDCAARGFSGMQLVTCQRYFSILPKGSLGKAQFSLTEESENPSPLQLDSGSTPSHSLFIVANYATPVQNQKSEGACTAFGFAHTFEANSAVLGFPVRVDAWKHWDAQRRQMHIFPSLEAALKRDFSGRRMKAARPIRGSAAAKSVLAQGRAIYVASGVGQDWMNPRGSQLSCVRMNESNGHAYSIQGYDESKQVFVVKNSWGDSWGEQGYHYLPISCLDSTADSMLLYDLEVR